MAQNVRHLALFFDFDLSQEPVMTVRRRRQSSKDPGAHVFCLEKIMDWSYTPTKLR
jgi:hypothetical protein